MRGSYGAGCCLCSIHTWDASPAERARRKGIEKYKCVNPNSQVSFCCRLCNRGFCNLCLLKVNEELKQMAKFLPFVSVPSPCPECRYWPRIPARHRKCSHSRKRRCYDSENVSARRKKKRKPKNIKTIIKEPCTKIDGALLFPEFNVGIVTSVKDYYLHALALEKYKALHGVVPHNVANKCNNVYFGFRKCITLNAMVVNSKRVAIITYAYKGSQARRKGAYHTELGTILMFLIRIHQV